MGPAADFRSATRAHTSALATLEKKTLFWLAHRMPSWVNSDHLTTVGFLSLFGVGLSYCYARQSTAGLLLANVAWMARWHECVIGSVRATAFTSITFWTPAAARLYLLESLCPAK